MPIAAKRALIDEDRALIDFCLTHRFHTKRALAKALDKTPTTVSGWGNRVPMPKAERRVLQMWKQDMEREGGERERPPTTVVEESTSVGTLQQRVSRIHARLGSQHALWSVLAALVSLFDHYTDKERHIIKE